MPKSKQSGGHRPPHFSMLRSFELADYITIANAWSGMGAIFWCMLAMRGGEAAYVCRMKACAFMLMGLVFDIFDGKVARWTGRASALGRELDSLSDVISFGAAPACLAVACGMDGGGDAIVLAAFAACGVSRLARYNVSATSLSEKEGKQAKVTHFEGAPIPSSLVLVGLMAFMIQYNYVGENLPGGFVRLPSVGWRIHPFVGLYAIMGGLFVSRTIRIPKL